MLADFEFEFSEIRGANISGRTLTLKIHPPLKSGLMPDDRLKAFNKDIKIHWLADARLTTNELRPLKSSC